MLLRRVRLSIAAALALGLAACAGHDASKSGIGSDEDASAQTGSLKATSAGLSAPEQSLRDLFRDLSSTPSGEHDVPAIAASSDRGYADALAKLPSAPARYEKLISDIRADVTRSQQLGGLVEQLGSTAASSDARRQRENAMLISEAERLLRQRGRMYRIALERLAVVSPAPSARDAERACAKLEQQLAGLKLSAAKIKTVAGGFEIRP